LVRLLICAGGTGGGVYPALAVLDRLNDEYSSVQTLWIGRTGGMEADLVKKAGVEFDEIPAAGVHGVGLRRLPGNAVQILRGMIAARKVLAQFNPDVLFFTGGYVAVPMALTGYRKPIVLYTPDIEPGLALKVLALFADRIAVTAPESKEFFLERKSVIVSGYPVRSGLSSWSMEDAIQVFGFTADLPTLLVTGGSLGSLTINKALVAVLPELLQEMQIVHITGQLTWPQFSELRASLPEDLAGRYRNYPYLHDEMGAAFRIADLVLSRAGASSIGEYPHFGIPAILVPYPHAWRYQKVNADYLARKGAAVILNDADLASRLRSTVLDLIRSPARLRRMKNAMEALRGKDAATVIAEQINQVAASNTHNRN
jgi:UDP-N-acetylglucosamine--N-acetylmuramyl-(pentapeptide) pyrophosphoryl-undecaprenol N-acetylglucosamine transferase